MRWAGLSWKGKVDDDDDDDDHHHHGPPPEAIRHN
jgi:hypothetical protein